MSEFHAPMLAYWAMSTLMFSKSLQILRQCLVASAQ
jgi:hypothetical protein